MSRVILFPVAAAIPDEGFVLSPFVALHDTVAGARRRHRRLVVAAGQWALARGVSLPADHVALWAAAAEQVGRLCAADEVTGPWRAAELHDFLWSTLGEWCAAAGCLPPADLPASLQHLFAFLADSNRLHPDSDPLPELRAVLAASGGFDRFRPPPITPHGPAAA